MVGIAVSAYYLFSGHKQEMEVSKTVLRMGCGDIKLLVSHLLEEKTEKQLMYPELKLLSCY